MKTVFYLEASRMENAGIPGGVTMNKKLIFLNVLLLIGVLLTACGTSASPLPAQNQANGVHEISFNLQATEPPLPIPTVIVNPTPGSGGASPQISSTNLLIYVLIGALILIALIAVLKR
jgi:hypothetical protein